MRERARIADRDTPVCYIDDFLRRNMPENFVYSENFTDDRRSPVKPGMTRKAFVMFA